MAYTPITEGAKGWAGLINTNFNISVGSVQTAGITVLNGLKVENTLGYQIIKNGDLTIVSTKGVLSGLTTDGLSTTDVASFPTGILSGHEDSEVLWGPSLKNNGSGANQFVNIYRNGDKIAAQTFDAQGANLVFGIDIWFAYKG